jgi:hypothetical protein
MNSFKTPFVSTYIIRGIENVSENSSRFPVSQVSMAKYNFKCAFRDPRNGEQVVDDDEFTLFSFPSCVEKLPKFVSQFNETLAEVIDFYYSSRDSYHQIPDHEIELIILSKF